MDLKAATLLRSHAAQHKLSLILSSSDQGKVAPMMPIEVQEQNEKLLSLRPNDGMLKGIWTGALGGYGGTMCLLITGYLLFDGDIEFAWQVFLVAMAMLIVPFLWEVLTPSSAPILLSRRTREIYFQHEGELYHTPWDDIRALAYEYKMVHQNIGAMTNSTLEILMQRFGKPDDHIFVALGLPMGKTLELQQHVWAYLQSYMDRGPWLDEQGNTTSSPEYVKQQIKLNQHHRRDDIKLPWRSFKETRSAGHLFQVCFYIILYPASALWDFTRDTAIKRSHHTWPDEVLERLKPDGPTSRLIDIESELVQSSSSGDTR
ncbi:DUF6708 domain-containing protein [Pseudomonas saliphila]|uniref:DUF6708 domain-containing protein n=1 Tax=Pseudomonas saliphila TaxID=2586906 RepID=UPI00123B04B7|nr:DUF6708 domain-containing protein [Pseudomonas saliphila]